MMTGSHRHTSKPRRESPNVTPLELHGPFARYDRAWVDALDPALPSEPRLVACHREPLPPHDPHKLILSGASLSAGALVVGYLAASLFL